MIKSGGLSLFLHGSLMASILTWGVPWGQPEVSPQSYSLEWVAPPQEVIPSPSIQKVSQEPILEEAKLSPKAKRVTPPPQVINPKGMGDQNIPPKPISMSPPSFPEEALDQEIEGTVILRITIGKTGKVVEVIIHKSSGSKLLDEAAKSHALSWRFEPGQGNGAPIDSMIDVPVPFQIAKQH